MTVTFKSKKIQLTEVNSKQSRLFRNDGGAVGSRRESAAGDGYTSRKPPKITAAERRVLALVAQARTNKEIAAELNISAATVKRHMEKILTKLRLRNRVQAAIYGLTLDGCPHESRAGCVVRELHAGGDGAPASWADGPIA